MSDQQPYNEPAFPASGHPGMQYVAQAGMSMRDYFAAQILPQVMREYFDANKPCFGADHFYQNVPAHAYRLADAMLRERTNP